MTRTATWRDSADTMTLPIVKETTPAPKPVDQDPFLNPAERGVK